MSTKLFSVLPMTQNFTLDPGHTYTGHITVAIPNDATEDFPYLVTITPFSVHGESYNADLTTTGEQSQIADWITIENPTGVVAPNHSVNINFTITVPKNAAPGGQYATLLVSSDPDAAIEAVQGSTINNLFQLASIIYADVSGQVVRGGSVRDNLVPGFSFEPTITTSAIVENTGNTHKDATIVIDIKNSLTGETVFPQSGRDTDGFFSEIIMPGTSRLINEKIENLPLLGVFTVNQTVYFNDVPYSVEQNLVICPLWFIFLVVFTITTIISSLVLRAKLRKKKRLML